MSITNEVKVTVKNLEFITKCILEPIEGDRYEIKRVEKVVYKERFITFDSVLVELSAVIGDVPYVAVGVVLKKVIDKTGAHYTTDSKLKVVNRRGAARVPCHASVVFQKGLNKACTDASTYDLSVTGVGLYLTKEEADTVEIGENCNLTIMTANNSVKALGTVVRVCETEESEYCRVGLQLVKPSKKYIGFVMAMQRRAAQKLG